MSIAAVKWALSVKTGPIKKLALVAIAECHNAETGQCFPSQAYVAKVIGQTERSARKHLSELAADGFFTRKRRYDQKGHRDNDCFTLNFEVTEPTGSLISGSLPEGAVSGSEGRLPEKSGAPTGNMASGTNRTGILEPEKREARETRPCSLTKMTKDWKPNADDITFARQWLTDLKIEYEALTFRNRWLQKDIARDWSLEWQTWIIRHVAHFNLAPVTPKASFTIKPGSKQWAAWRAHYVAAGRVPSVEHMDRSKEIPVPSEWPPQVAAA